MAEEDGDSGGNVQAAAVDVDPSHPIKAYLGLALAQLNEFYTLYRREQAEKQDCKPNTETEIHLPGNQVINFRSFMLAFDARCWIPQRPNSYDNYLDYTCRLPESPGKMIDKISVNAGGQYMIDINDYWLVRCILELTLDSGEWHKQALDEGNQIAAQDCQYRYGSQDRQGLPLTKCQEPTYDTPPQWGDGNVAYYAGTSESTAYRKRFGVYNQENLNSRNLPDPWFNEDIKLDNGAEKKAQLPAEDSKRRADPNVTCHVSPGTTDDTYLMPAYADGSRYPWEQSPDDLKQQGAEGYPRPGHESVTVGSDAHKPRRPVYEQHSSTFSVTNLYTIFNQMYPAIIDAAMLNQITLVIRWRSGHCCPCSRVRDSMTLQTLDVRGARDEKLKAANTVDNTNNGIPGQGNDIVPFKWYYTDKANNLGEPDGTGHRHVHYAFGNDNLFCDPAPLSDTTYTQTGRPEWTRGTNHNRVPLKNTYHKATSREYPPTPTFEVTNIALNYETISMDSPLYTKQIQQLQQQGALEYQFRNYYVHGSYHQHCTTTQEHTQCLTRVYSVLQPPDHDVASPPVQMKDNPGDETMNHMPPTMARSHRFSTMNIDSWQHEINGSKFPGYRVKPSDTYHLFFDGTATNTHLVRNIRDFADYKYVQCTRVAFPHGNDRSLDGLDIRGVSSNLRLYTWMEGREFMEPVDPRGITPRSINALNLNGKRSKLRESEDRLGTTIHRNPQDQLWRYGEFYAAPSEETASLTRQESYNDTNYKWDANKEGAQPLSALTDNYPDLASVMKGKFVRPVTYPNGVFARLILESKATMRIGTGRQMQVIP
jgi:hypothetical protein